MQQSCREASVVEPDHPAKGHQRDCDWSCFRKARELSSLRYRRMSNGGRLTTTAISSGVNGRDRPGLLAPRAPLRRTIFRIPYYLRTTVHCHQPGTGGTGGAAPPALTLCCRPVRPSMRIDKSGRWRSRKQGCERRGHLFLQDRLNSTHNLLPLIGFDHELVMHLEDELCLPGQLFVEPVADANGCFNSDHRSCSLDRQVEREVPPPEHPAVGCNAVGIRCGTRKGTRGRGLLAA